MTDPKRIAGLLGPTLVVLSVSEMITADIWASVSVTQTYLAGALWFVAGLAIIRAHNRWTGGWPALVTLVGWFAILGGLFRMFAPGFAQGATPNASVVLGIQAVLLLVGLVLTFKAYARS